MGRSRFPAYPPDIDDRLQLFLESVRKELESVGSKGSATIRVEESDVAVSAAAHTLDFLGADFVLTQSPVGEVNVSIESNLARLNAAQTWTTLQTFSQGIDVTLGGNVSLGAQAGKLRIQRGSAEQISFLGESNAFASLRAIGAVLGATDPGGTQVLRVDGSVVAVGEYRSLLNTVDVRVGAEAFATGIGAVGTVSAHDFRIYRNAVLKATFASALTTFVDQVVIGSDTGTTHTLRVGGTINANNLFKLDPIGVGFYAVFIADSGVADRGGLLLNNSTGAVRHMKLAPTFTGSPGTSSRFRMGWVTDADKETFINTAALEITPDNKIILAGSGSNVLDFTTTGEQGILARSSTGVSIRLVSRFTDDNVYHDAPLGHTFRVNANTALTNGLQISSGANVTFFGALFPNTTLTRDIGSTTFEFRDAFLRRIRLSDVTDASLSSTDHAFQIGPTTGVNIIMDDNELMARNNGAISTLNLNADGGAVTVHANLTTGAAVGAIQMGGQSGSSIGIRSTTTREVLLAAMYRADAFGPIIRLRQSRGTFGSEAQTLSGDEVAVYQGQGRGATGFFNAGWLSFVARENWTDIAQGAQLEFWLTAIGASGSGQRLVLRTNELIPASSGGLTLGSASLPFGTTYVGEGGSLIVRPQDGVNEGGEIQLVGAGANATWFLDNNAGNVRFFTGGIERWRLTTTAMTPGTTAGGVTLGSSTVPYGNAHTRLLTVYDTSNVSRIQMGESGTATGIELGRQDGTAATAFVDFHTGATAVDYDSRIIGSGGDGTVGAGTLKIVAGLFQLEPNANRDPIFRITPTATDTLSNAAILIQRAGESGQRLRIHKDGTLAWGSATASQEILLQRVDSNTLEVTKDWKIASLGVFDSTDVPTEGQLLIYKTGTINKWQAESLNAIWGDTDFKAAILADGAATFIFFDPGTGADSPVGAPPDPGALTVTQQHGTHTVELRDYVKPADFRWFEFQYDKNSSGVWIALADATSPKVVHSRLPFDGTTFRYRVRVRDRAGNFSNFSPIAGPFTPIRTGETHAFGAVIAGEIAVANLAAITATMGILTSGQIRGPGNTAGINFSGAGGIPGTWTAGINFENTSLSGMTRFLNFHSSAGNAFLKHERTEINHDGSVRFYSTSTQPLFDLSSTIFRLQENAASPVRGVNVMGSVPGGWTTYVNVNGTGSFLKHDRLQADFDGTVLMYQSSSQPMFKLNATDFLLQEDAVTPAKGILIDGTIPAAWTSFLDLTATGTNPFLKHAPGGNTTLQLLANGAFDVGPGQTGTPPSGLARIYTKGATNPSALFWKNDAGTEFVVGLRIVDRSEFNAGGTWTKPSTAVMVMVHVWGAGGGGGGGAAATSGNAAGGGAGGGGCYSFALYRAVDLGATESITVGTGGTAGGGGSNANGTAGGNGTRSSFGTLLHAYGGAGGAGGTQGATTANGGGGGGILASGSGTGGGSGSSGGFGGGAAGNPGGFSVYGGGGGGNVNASGSAGGVAFYGAGGGGGGGVGSGTPTGGGAGGRSGSDGNGTLSGGGGAGGSGGATGGAGTAGANGTTEYRSGAGGGGGGGSTSGSAGVGGNGGTPGGGAGGGGGNVRATAPVGANGGAGSNGRVIVYSFG